MISKILEPKIKKLDAYQAQITALRPLTHHELTELKSYYKVGLTYTSNAIEGNSLTETETKVVLEEGITIGGKPLKDHLEALGHQDAFDQIYQWLNQPLTEALICECHRLFYYRIDQEKAGVYRQERVFVSGVARAFPSPEKIAFEMAELIAKWEALDSGMHPVLKAAWLHYHFVDIHPFIDGNGRTARLLMNLILIQNGYPVAIIPPINRVAYLASLKRYNQGESDEFFEFIIDAVIEAQKDYLRLLS